MEAVDLPAARKQAFATLMHCAQVVAGVPVLAILFTRQDGRSWYTLSCVDGMTNKQSVELLRSMADTLESEAGETP